jgi:hypothetical protein
MKIGWVKVGVYVVIVALLIVGAYVSTGSIGTAIGVMAAWAGGVILRKTFLGKEDRSKENKDTV